MTQLWTNTLEKKGLFGHDQIRLNSLVHNLGRFPNFNSYKLSVLSHKCDRRESKLPISIHFSKYNT